MRRRDLTGAVDAAYTGDPEFDRAVHVETAAADDVIRAVLTRPVVRSGVARFLAHGFHDVILLGKEAAVEAVAHEPASALLSAAALGDELALAEGLMEQLRFALRV